MKVPGPPPTPLSTSLWLIWAGWKSPKIGKSSSRWSPLTTCLRQSAYFTHESDFSTLEFSGLVSSTTCLYKVLANLGLWICLKLGWFCRNMCLFCRNISVLSAIRLRLWSYCVFMLSECCFFTQVWVIYMFKIVVYVSIWNSTDKNFAGVPPCVFCFTLNPKP